jgi:hypothetical protein
MWNTMGHLRASRQESREKAAFSPYFGAPRHHG